MKVRDIVSRVREYLDEVDAINNVEVLNGSTPVDSRIIELIPECAVMLMDGKPISEEIRSTFYVDETGKGVMDVPADWGRLYEIRLSCWQRSVYHTIEEHSEQYRRQHSKVTRGGVVRPVVAIVPYGDSRKLELYSVPAWDGRVSIDRASYVALPPIKDEDSDIDVREDKLSMLCYMIAVRVARTYGDAASVELLSHSLNEELAKSKIKI